MVDGQKVTDGQRQFHSPPLFLLGDNSIFSERWEYKQKIKKKTQKNDKRETYVSKKKVYILENEYDHDDEREWQYYRSLGLGQ